MNRTVRRSAGFTLIEMMIVLVVVAILLLVALPAYQSQSLRAKRSVAKIELMKIAARQEQFFLNNRAYSATLAPLGFADPWIVDANGNETGAASADRIYKISFAASSATAYELQAVPESRQAADTVCGTLKISSTGVKTITGTGTVASCW